MSSQKCENCHWFRAKEPNADGVVEKGYCMFKVRRCASAANDPNSRRLLLMPTVDSAHVCEHHFPNDVAEKIFA